LLIVSQIYIRLIMKINFKSAQVNILAMSDQHGHIEKTGTLDASVQQNFDELFPNRNAKGTANVLAVVGDWGMDASGVKFITKHKPEEMGFEDKKTEHKLFGRFSLNYADNFINKFKSIINKSQKQPYELPEKDSEGKRKMFNGEYQIFLLRKFIERLKYDDAGNSRFELNKGFFSKVPDKNDINYELLAQNNDTSKNRGEITNKNFEVLMITGNHDLEGGDSLLFSFLDKIKNNITVLATNTNFEKSPVFQGRDYVKEYSILEVEDDKDKNKKHKVLFIGIIPHRMDFYAEGKTNGMGIIDKTAEYTMDLESPETLKNTYAKINTLIKAFKDTNPDGATVILNHNGNPVAEKFIQKLWKYDKNLQIDLILNAHDHKYGINQIKNPEGKITPIVSLGQDNKIYADAKLKFNDDKTLTVACNNDYSVSNGPESLNTPLGKVFQEILKDDFEPKIKITVKGRPDLTELDYDTSRYGNCILDNFLTDGILQSIKKHDESIDFFGMTGGVVRGALNCNDKLANNFQLFNTLSGGPPEHFEVYILKNISDKELVKIVTNSLFRNKLDEKRKDLIQWSGISVNKKEIWKLIDETIKKENPIKNDFVSIENKLDYDKIKNHIKIKDKNGNYISIDENRKYNLALGYVSILLHETLSDYLNKGKISPMAIKNNSGEVKNAQMRELFDEYLEKHYNPDTGLYEIEIEDPDKDVRIIT